MPSHSPTAPRRVPQQKRGRRRVAGFLRAAEVVFGEMGYEQATMNAIAERADSCIGSLYQFFPNKVALADAIRERYINEIEQSWVALSREAATLSPEKLASRLVGLQIEIVRSRPALLALLDVPPTARTTTRREWRRPNLRRSISQGDWNTQPRSDESRRIARTCEWHRHIALRRSRTFPAGYSLPSNEGGA